MVKVLVNFFRLFGFKKFYLKSSKKNELKCPVQIILIILGYFLGFKDPEVLKRKPSSWSF